MPRGLVSLINRNRTALARLISKPPRFCVSMCAVTVVHGSTGFTGVHGGALAHTGFHGSSRGFTGFHGVSRGFTGAHRGLEVSTRTAVAAPWSLTVTIKQDGFKYRHRPAHRAKRPCVSKTTCLADSITTRGNTRMLRCIGSGIPALLEVAPVEMTTTTRIPLPQPPPAALAAVDPPPSLPKPRPHASLKSDSPPPLSKRRPHAPPHAVPPLSLARHPHAHWPDSL